MLKERGIAREWLTRVVGEPARIERRDDGTIHYLKTIPEYEGRVLRVVTRTEGEQTIVVTVFFDRRQRGKV
ncbi:MAG: DUF4258 domain-containing protein [Chloroflexi bacterium]|nr:DUF4258 domain-containing protein [Chloroflexota bacterium]